MTEIEKKALELVNEVRAEDGYTVPITYDWFNADSFEHQAFLRAIEQHEAFRQEVSDAVELHQANMYLKDMALERFIIAKPDPLVEAVKDILDDDSKDNAEEFSDAIREALAKRGLEIREKE